MQRTRANRDLRVRLGDVGDVDGGWSIGTGVALTVGRLGLGNWREGREKRARREGTDGEGEARRLDRRKLYL